MIKYADQNTKEIDFINITNLLASRLADRGHALTDINKNIKKCYHDYKKGKLIAKDKTKTVEKQTFLKILFDPNAVNKKLLKQELGIEELDMILAEEKTGKTTICYKGGPNLGKLVTNTSMLKSHPKVSEVLNGLNPTRDDDRDKEQGPKRKWDGVIRNPYKKLK